MSRPWMKWYPRDWRADPRLRMCSLSARGLWTELIGYMHEAEPYGHLLIDGKQPIIDDVAALVGRPLAEVRKAMVELCERGVYSITDRGIIFSRRMVRDGNRSEEGRKQVEKRWGDREPNSGPNRSNDKTPITQMPDTRKKERENAGASGLISPEAIELSKSFLQAIGVDSEDPELSGMSGVPYTAAMWISRGYDRSLILSTAANIFASHGQKPLSYYTKSIDREHADQANKPAQPKGQFHETGRQNRSGRSAITAAIDSHIERFQRESDDSSEIREAAPRLLSNG